MGKKVVVITGAGSGLGESLAKKYSDLGYHICLLGRKKERLLRTAQTLSAGYTIYELDVSQNRDVRNIFQSIKAELGQVDILINNAGTGAFDLAESISEDNIHHMIDVNLKGTIFCTQAVLPDMKKRNEGIIVNIVSTAGLEGKVSESVYCASKFGVRGFTDSVFLELKESKVQIYAAYMGGMKTEFWEGIYTEDEIKNLMEPDDVAEIIMDNIKPRRNLAVREVVIKNKI